MVKDRIIIFFQSFLTVKKIQYLLILVLGIGLVAFLVISKSQTDNRSKASTSALQEAENGNLVGSIQTGADSSASGGKYIVFGQAVAVPPTATPTPTTAPRIPTNTPTPTPVPPVSIQQKTGLLGTSLDEWSVNDNATNVINAYGFAWFTPGNEMKMQFDDTCQRDGSGNIKYDFTLGDKYMNYGKNLGMRINGNTIVWHNQTSSCASSYTKNDFVNYVRTVAQHYCGQVYSFDVVNEALSDSGGYRTDSVWYKLYGGPSYITTAFQTARAACPSMKLYYNDYGTESGGKANDMMNLIVTPLKNQGLIDGVGFQTHITVSDGLQSLQAQMKRVSDLGLEVAISEMDVRFSKEYTQVTSQDLTTQANLYKQAATFCVQNPKCVRFTTWGIDDGTSWINGLDLGQGKHNDAPLMFDRSYKPKPAYCTGVQPVLGTPKGAC